MSFSGLFAPSSCNGSYDLLKDKSCYGDGREASLEGLGGNVATWRKIFFSSFNKIK